MGTRGRASDCGGRLIIEASVMMDTCVCFQILFSAGPCAAMPVIGTGEGGARRKMPWGDDKEDI